LLRQSFDNGSAVIRRLPNDGIVIQSVSRSQSILRVKIGFIVGANSCRYAALRPRATAPVSQSARRNDDNGDWS
jgi:hypothetical protein